MFPEPGKEAKAVNDVGVGKWLGWAQNLDEVSLSVWWV